MFIYTEAFEKRYEVKSLGYDLDRVSARVAEIAGMEKSDNLRAICRTLARWNDERTPVGE